MAQRGNRAKGLQTACLSAVAILFGLVFAFPLLRHFSNIGRIADWDTILNMQWVPYHIVSHFHQFPFWNPYECGGVPLLGNPQSRFLSPFFLLHLLFGPVVGFHLEIILHLAIAWGGGYVLARSYGISPLASTLCGSIFAGSSWFSLHLAVGHSIFMSSVYLPWIVALLGHSFSERSLISAVGSGILIALIVVEGGVYQVLQAFILVGLLGISVSVISRSYWPIVMVALVAALSVGFAAFKLLLDYAMVQAYPRPWDTFEYTPLRLVYVSLFSRVQIIGQAAFLGKWEVWEYGAYIGPIAAALALIGVVKYPHGAAPWIVSCVVFLVLATGDSSVYSPWTLLHKLPVFSSLRVPSRFLVPFTLTIGMLAAFGGEAILKRFQTWGPYALCIVMCVMLVDFWQVSVPNLRHVVLSGFEDLAPASSSFKQIRDPSDTHMLMASMANEGSLNCYEYTTIPTVAKGFNEPTYRGEEYLLGTGSVRLTRWTPNVLDFVVDAPLSTTMVVNQNYDPSWQLVEGRGRVLTSGGLLAIDIPPGKQALRLAYRSRPFHTGLAISMLTLLVALMVLVDERRRRI